MDNPDKHLTNVAININSPNYVKKIGGKWFLNDIKLYMMSKYGIEKTNQAFSGIQKAIIKSLIAVQKLVANDKRSFELYGYDFLFDSKMKAWLLEVNGGPSMSANTDTDSELKVGLIDDVMTILDLEKM
jgi:tubulin polyglutamylase TTLL9